MRDRLFGGEDEICWRHLLQARHIPDWRLPEELLVLAVEIRRVIVADAEPGARRVHILREHKPTRLLHSQMFLVLQRAHGRDGPEVLVEAGLAHSDIAGNLLDAEWPVVLGPDPVDGPGDAVRGAAQHRQVAEPAALLA